MLILLKLSLERATIEEREQIKRITAYLKEHKYPYMIQANEEDCEVFPISLGNIVTEIDTETEFEEFIGFLRDCEVERTQICMVYQLDYLRGDGEDIHACFPFNMKIDRFISELSGQ
jgi:hypothetical protein